MTSYKKCAGCGLELQTDNESKQGYIPNIDAKYCVRCFRLEHYGEKENNLTDFNIEQYLDSISNSSYETILVIDVTNPYQTLIENINKYVEPSKLTLVVNKIDILPQSIKHESIVEWIDNLSIDKGIEFKNIVLASSTKLWNIDALRNYIEALDAPINIIGYSNVGKSSLIKAIFKSEMKTADNITSNTIGTTLEPIELPFNEQSIIDYPGFYLVGNIQNVLTMEQLQKVMPKKEIKVINYNLSRDQVINIGDVASFCLEGGDKTPIQFTFSNELELERHKLDTLEIPTGFVKHDIEQLDFAKQDLIITGLGKVTFNKSTAKLSIVLPKGITFDVVESLYN